MEVNYYRLKPVAWVATETRLKPPKPRSHQFENCLLP